MSAFEVSLGHSLVPPKASGRFGRCVQEWDGFWFDHLTGEWGVEESTATSQPWGAH